MSILTSASRNSVSRGYDYYNSDRVENIQELSDHEYEGYVSGSSNKPYYVKIDVEHPRKSYCDCPFADGNKTCKHMVALYFSIFQDEAEDYKDWLTSDYDYYDDDEDDYGYNSYYDNEYFDFTPREKFEKPLFYDEVLKNFVNNLNEKEMRKILIEELKTNEESAYHKYLKKDYDKYLKNNNNEFLFLEKLNQKIKNLLSIYDYNYYDFNKEILNNQEKKKIKELYENNCYEDILDQILFIPELAAFSDFKWLANLYKRVKSDNKMMIFIASLEDYLNSLKHYSIKNTLPKSNILIIIDMLSNYNLNEKARELLNNDKYLEYVDYIIDNTDNYMDLYNKFMKLISNNYLKNKQYIPEVLYRFEYKDEHENEEIRKNHCVYSYLCLKREEYLQMLNIFMDKKSIEKIIEQKTKDIFLLIKLYRFCDNQDKLYNLIINSEYKNQLLYNVEFLKEKYQDELYNYFLNEFYNTLKIDKRRPVYHEAVKYVEGILQLNNGSILVNNLINDLKQSDYSKCNALFDEIKIVVNKI